MKSIINRNRSRRVRSYFRNASASYDKQKQQEKAVRKNIAKGEK